MLEGVGDEFAGGQDSQVVKFHVKPPGRQHAGGEGPGAGSRLHSAQQVQRRVVEQLGGRARTRGVLDDQHRDIVVVLGRDAERADQPVADDLRGTGRTGQCALQSGHALVDVLTPALDQTVGVEHGGGAGRQRDRVRRVLPAARPERRTCRVCGAAYRAVLVPDQYRQMAGRCVDQAALIGVVDRVEAGGDLVGVDLGGEAVQELKDLVRGQVQPGIGTDGRAELAHDRGGPDPAAHDIADDQGRAPGAEGDHVVPVAADGRVRAARLVGGRDTQVVGLLQLLGKQ